MNLYIATCIVFSHTMTQLSRQGALHAYHVGSVIAGEARLSITKHHQPVSYRVLCRAECSLLLCRYTNTSAVISHISFIDGDKGILRYRYVAAKQLALNVLAPQLMIHHI
jgi:hypothetical protein